MEKKNETIIYRESLFQSLAADIASMLLLGVGFYANVHYIQSKLFAAIIVLLFALTMIACVSARKNVFTDKEKAIEYLKAL